MIPLGFPYYQLINIGCFPSFPYFRLIHVRWIPSLNIKSLGIPLPENKKLPHLHFMFFDRYEIHVQTFGDVSYRQFIIFQSSSSQSDIKQMYSCWYKKHVHQKNNKKTKTKWWIYLSKISKHFKISDSHIWKYMLRMIPYLSCIR